MSPNISNSFTDVDYICIENNKYITGLTYS